MALSIIVLCKFEISSDFHKTCAEKFRKGSQIMPGCGTHLGPANKLENHGNLSEGLFSDLDSYFVSSERKSHIE